MKKLFIIFLVLLGFSLANQVAAQKAKVRYSHNENKEGKASFYHNKFNGRKTSTGEIFRNSGYTAASNHFKLGTYVKVTNKRNGKEVYVKINDRMGHPGRIIDLTHKAASDLSFINSGVTNVSVEVVSPEEGKRKILAQTGGAQEPSKTL